MARARDEAREQRILMEAVVDAYGSSERAMGWYYYLDGKMNVPFKARCRLARPISILKVNEEVEVLGMAPEEECESEMFVWVRRAGERIAVPLAQLMTYPAGEAYACHCRLAEPWPSHQAQKNGGIRRR